MSETLIIKGLKEIYSEYDTFILDQWGVMHDGRKGYKKAIECLDKLFLEKKNLVIISNSSKRKVLTIKRLHELGFKNEQFIEVMTSGEMIWQSLFNDNFKEIKNSGKRCFHIFNNAKEDSKNFLDGLDKFKFVDNINKSDFILGCTPFINSQILDYIPILEVALKKNIPFICANPDFETVNDLKSRKNIFCMGTISELYKNMGGCTFILGKPSTEIYAKTLQKINSYKKSKVLAIGDSIHHDIQGANHFGIDSLLITSTGIHKDYFDIENLKWDSSLNPLHKLDIKPTFICQEFIF